MKKHLLKRCVLIISLIVTGGGLFAQNTLRAIVTDSSTHEKLNGVVIVITKTTNGGVSDSSGMVEIKNIANGDQVIEASYVGYQKKVLSLHFPMPNSKPVQILLQPEQSEIEEVVVSSMRTNSRIEDIPIKVEVIGIDDLTEESSFKPGNVSSILGDVSGVQIQQTSAVSGNSVVRMQGLDGRYTMLLRDGMPAYTGLSGGLSILQIPPLDLKQVEIIKGPASTINGGGAIAGLINFITKEPTDSSEATFLLNQSTLSETNMNAYFSGKKNNIGYTFFGGINHQFAMDVNHDGFSDVPKTLSFLLHPQLFFYPDDKTKLRIGILANYDNRLGGDMQVIQGEADSAHQYYEKNVSENYGFDWMLSHVITDKQDNSFKGSIDYSSRDFETNYSNLSGNQMSAYSELYYHLGLNQHNFIFGGNYLADLYRRNTGDTSTFNNYTYQTIGLFTQYSYTIPDLLNFQAGLRGDWHNVYGFFVLPSVAALIHATKEFSVRINGGTGYKVPNLLEIAAQNEDFSPVVPTSTLKDEKSYGGTVEWNYKKVFTDKQVVLFVNQTFFYTYVQQAIIETENPDGSYSVSNTSGGATTMGIDNYVRVSRKPIDFYLGYTFTYPRKNSDKAEPYLTLTPLNRAAAVLTSDIGKHFKVGLEGSLIGPQYLDDGSKTKTYFLLAASVQYNVGRVTLVVNGENLLDVRQTRFGPVVYPPYDTHPQFAQIWAPVDGRVINFSVMVHI